MNVYKLRRRLLPADPTQCLEKLLAGARAGTVTGLAYVAILDGSGYIMDTCGEASVDLIATRLMLKALDARLAKRQVAAREDKP